MRLLFFVLFLAGGAITMWRRWDARRRLGQLERGERCLSCDGTQVTKDGDVIRCETCGHATPIASLGAGGSVSEEELKALTRGDDRGMLP